MKLERALRTRLERFDDAQRLGSQSQGVAKRSLRPLGSQLNSGARSALTLSGSLLVTAACTTEFDLFGDRGQRRQSGGAGGAGPAPGLGGSSLGGLGGGEQFVELIAKARLSLLDAAGSDVEIHSFYFWYAEGITISGRGPLGVGTAHVTSSVESTASDYVDPYLALDDDRTTTWTLPAAEVPGWLQVQYDLPIPVPELVAVEVTDPENRAPRTVRLEVDNTQGAWLVFEYDIETWVEDADVEPIERQQRVFAVPPLSEWESTQF